MANERSETEVYQEIVADVKAVFAKKPPQSASGDTVSFEIARRWAKHKGRKFDAPKPDAIGGVGNTTVSPPPGERKVSPIKMPEEVRKD